MATDIESIARNVLINILQEYDESAAINFKPTSDLNILELLDSFLVVNMLIELEGELGIMSGRPISLADGDIFHASKSPLLTWKAWLEYVNEKYGD